MAQGTTGSTGDSAHLGFKAARDHLLRHRGDLAGARSFPLSLIHI